MPRCLIPPNPGGPHYWLAVLACLLWGASMFMLITQTGRRFGSGKKKWWIVLSVLGVYLASTIPGALVTTLWEERSIHPLLASWALHYLDPGVLPLLIAIGCVGFARLPETSVKYPNQTLFWRRKRWIFIAGGIGLVLAVGFHLLDAAHYNIFQFHSLSKTLHDFCAYFALAGAFVYLVIPVLWNFGWKNWLWKAAFILTVVMLFLLLHEMLHPLPPGVYHPTQIDWNHWGRVVRCAFSYRR